MEQKANMGVGEDHGKMTEIRRILAKNGILMTDPQMDGLSRFVEGLKQWNTRINLVSRRDVDNLWESHILHSLAVVLEVRIPQGARVLDLGSGGGLPGVPVRLIRPDLTMTLLDATKKKVDAVGSILADLGLRGVEAIWGRAEDPKVITALKGRFDVVIARAVAPLSNLVAWSRPYISPLPPGTQPLPQLIALKGGDLGDELERVRRFGGVKDVRSKELTFFGAEKIPGINKQVVSVFF